MVNFLAIIWFFISPILFILAEMTTAKSDIDMKRPSHHTDDGFINPFYHAQGRFIDFLRWQFGRGPDEAPVVPAGDLPESKPAPVEPDLGQIMNSESSQYNITWIGHSTFLIQKGGVNLLTDPIFSERCSPVSFTGPSRSFPPGIDQEDLPEIDIVLISHDHYDHLDLPTIEKLGNRPVYFVPLGLAEWFNDLGLTNVIELDWWQSHEFKDLTLHCVPAQHFSGRSLFDRNNRLWCGWVVQNNDGNLFFAGDTGYSPQFRQIGERFKRMRVSLIPIGAYKPRWFMSPVHVNPPEAVQIHLDVNSAVSVGMHWGTFTLTDEPFTEPPLYLKKSLADSNLPAETFIVMRIGETRRF